MEEIQNQAPSDIAQPVLPKAKLSPAQYRTRVVQDALASAAAAKAEEERERERIAALPPRPRGRPRKVVQFEDLSPAKQKEQLAVQAATDLLAMIPELKEQAAALTLSDWWWRCAETILRDYNTHPPAYIEQPVELVLGTDDETDTDKRATYHLDAMARDIVDEIKFHKIKLDDDFGNLVFQILGFALVNAEKFTNRDSFVGLADITKMYQKLERKYGS